MKLTISYIKTDWKVKTWKCCGYFWELIITPKLSKREAWEPICPNCSKKGGIILNTSMPMERISPRALSEATVEFFKDKLNDLHRYRKSSLVYHRNGYYVSNNFIPWNLR